MALLGLGQRSLYMALTTELKEVLWQSRCHFVEEKEDFDADKIWYLRLSRATIYTNGGYQWLQVISYAVETTRFQKQKD